MEDDSSNLHHQHHNRGRQTLDKARSSRTTTAKSSDAAGDDNGDFSGGSYADGLGEDCGDGESEVWGSFTESFRRVQSVLDRNRVLIQQVNENHQSKIHGNMVKNVALIQEINGNISKVVSLYSDLSVNFSSMINGNTVIDLNNGAEGDTSQPPSDESQ